MKRTILGVLCTVVLLALTAVAASARELTVNSILAAHRSGASTTSIIAMVNSSGNIIAMTAGDIATLRQAGVSESVITAVWAHIPAPTPAHVPLQPDDSRLVGFVRLLNSGMSESIILEQVRQSDQGYTLSVNDLLYLKQNGAREAMIAALMATGTGVPAEPAVAPSALVFDDLEMLRVGFWRRHRIGHLVLEGDVFTWKDNRNPKQNFTFQVAGLEKVWLTCEARTYENFCYEINFKIVKGDRYRFRDINRDSGSNAAVTKVMEALRTYFPRLNFSPPDVK